MFKNSPRFIKWLLYSFMSIISIALLLFILIVLKFFSGDFIGRESGPESIILQPDSLGLNSETVRFPARDGLSIEGWMLSAEPSGKAVIVLSHGGGSNRSAMLSRASSLINGGYDVLAIDLRAHGGSQGELNSLGMMEALDILGAMDYLKAKNDNRPIILMGLSLGSVSSINAACQSSQAVAVIAEGAFKSYRDPIRTFAEYTLRDPGISFLTRIRNAIVDWSCVDLLTRLEILFHTGIFIDPDKTNAISSVAKMQNMPILYNTGENDFMEPDLHAREMYNLSDSELSEIIIIKGAGHSAYNDETRVAYNKAVLGFLDRVLD
jgi:pimeloyl-ACP methyl ester carboxylesterase